MLREQFDQGSIGFAIVRLGTEINDKFARGGFDDFFLR